MNEMVTSLLLIGVPLILVGAGVHAPHPIPFDVGLGCICVVLGRVLDVLLGRLDGKK